jgi:hypothetical protein
VAAPVSKNAPEDKAPEGKSLLESAGADKPDNPDKSEGVEGDSKDGDGKDAKDVKDKEKDEAKPGEATPLRVEDLVIPEGKSWDEEAGKGFLDLINDVSIPRNQLGQKMIDMYSGLQDKTFEGQRAAAAAQAEADMARLAETEAEWAQSAKADKEFGGSNWESSQSVIAAGRDRLATPEAVKIIEAYGFGNHPEILRMFYRAGKMLDEDRMDGRGGVALKPDEEVFYGK